MAKNSMKTMVHNIYYPHLTNCTDFFTGTYAVIFYAVNLFKDIGKYLPLIYFTQNIKFSTNCIIITRNL